MAETEGITGFTTDIQIGDGQTPENFSSITEPKDITGPQVTPEFVDFTHQQSPAGFRERKPTFKSSGDITFRCNYISDDPTHQALIAAATANPPTKKNFKLIFPDSSGFSFSAYVSLQWIAPMNGPLEIAVTLNISGSITELA